MLRPLLILFFLLASALLLAQDNDANWSHLLDDPSRQSPYFHILAQDFDRINHEIVRRLDKDHLVVKLKESALLDSSGLASISNDWKLNVRDATSEGVYYVKSILRLDLQSFSNLRVLSTYKNTYMVSGKWKDILMLKENPLIVHISNESSKPKTDARVIDMNLNPNRVNKVHHLYPDLTGAEMVISIQENQFRQSDIDLVGRSIENSISSASVDNHATEMATIMAGAGNSFITGRGVAKNARLVSSDFSDVLPDNDSDYQSLSIQTQNHSYGTEIESFYGAQAQAFDQSATGNPELLHVFSSGNQGFEVSQDGTYAELPGYANLTGNFKMAKNVLVVGSVDTVGHAVTFTSNGPAYDGRVKPEIVAYSVAGSSNAAALVSGLATLLQNQYRNRYSDNMPSALARALLINAAEDVASDGLDFKTGYGSVSAAKSLKTLNEENFILDAIGEGEQLTFPLSIPANAVNLKVTLSWTDPASDIGSFKALINDLDLRLLSSSNEEVLPWVLNANASLEALAAPAVRALDKLNNNEQISLSIPTDTNYTIEVNGFEVSGTQKFAIAYQYDLANTFEWDYPTGSDNMPYNGESGSYFRWQSTLDESFGRLEYSIDNGTSWETLVENLDLSTGFWRWNAPFGLNAEAQARMVTGTQSFETEVFTISNPVDVSVGFICSDSVRLQWDQLPNAVQYEVYSMGGTNLELFTSTTDTALIIPDIEVLQDTRFAVVPVLPSGKKLIPSQTLDITQQAIECFVFSFFQEVALDSGIFLNLRLGTNYGVKKITFQRQSTKGTVEVETFNSPATSSFRVQDQFPDQGNNTHRVILDFDNGEQLVREATNTYYLTELPLLLFPNPIIEGEEITLLTKELTSENPQFVVVDSRGLEVVDIPIRSTQISIPTFGLKPGIYYYKLIDGSESYSGRILIK